jgi:hypothetical protein
VHLHIVILSDRILPFRFAMTTPYCNWNPTLDTYGLALAYRAHVLQDTIMEVGNAIQVDLVAYLHLSFIMDTNWWVVLLDMVVADRLGH